MPRVWGETERVKEELNSCKEGGRKRSGEKKDLFRNVSNAILSHNQAHV